MKKWATLILLITQMLFTGCKSKDTKLVDALKNNADYSTIENLINDGAIPSHKHVNVVLEKVIDDLTQIKELEGNDTLQQVSRENKLLIEQLRANIKANKKIVKLLDSNM